MRSTADGSVVGSGVIGASVAFHLSQPGVRDVVLLERGELPCGVTRRCGALVRRHHTNASEARLTSASLRWFEDWTDRVGGEWGFARTGFVHLVAVSDSARLQTNVSMPTGVSVGTCVMDASELYVLNSWLALASADVGAFEPRSGYADSVATTRTLAVPTIRGGAQTLDHSTALRLLASGNRVTGVQSDSGSFQAETIVQANCCCAIPLVEPSGLHVPIDTVAAQVAFVSRPDRLLGSVGHLTTIDRRSGICAGSNGVTETLVGISQSARRTESLGDVWVSSSLPETALQRRALSKPEFADRRVFRAHAGPLDVTPDRAAPIWKADGLGELVLAVGMGGSGFKRAPAIGACVAELGVESRSRTASIDESARSRFVEGRPIVSHEYVLGNTAGGTRPVLSH